MATKAVIAVIILLAVGWWWWWKKSQKPRWNYVSTSDWQRLLNQPTPLFSPARVCVFSFDDRKNNPDIEKLKAFNAAYCRKQGYDFQFFSEDLQGHPPYWTKVRLAQDLMSTGKYDFIMWVDSDAVIHNPNFRLETIFPAFQEDAFLVLASDPPRWNAPFNAGVWIFQYGPLAQQFCQDWLLKYPPAKWQKIDGKKWKCEACLWAGSSYEQGAGAELLSQDPYRKHVICLPWQALQAKEPNPLSFTLHFASPQTKAEIKEYSQDS